jgi:sensor domain CHASE-containing protein
VVHKRDRVCTSQMQLSYGKWHGTAAAHTGDLPTRQPARTAVRNNQGNIKIWVMFLNSVSQ